jgi:hypothetical protein
MPRTRPNGREIEAAEGGAMSNKRFVVTEISGWLIDPASRGNSTNPGTSYSVIDTEACCREVGRFYSSRLTTQKNNRLQAQRLCDELNALEDEWEAEHGNT